MQIEWSETYATGIDEIDGHHKKLVELLNTSYSLILNDNNQKELLQLLDELIDYAKYHFDAEEQLMQKYAYKQMDAHMIEHFSFINRVMSYQNEIVYGKKYLSVDVFDFIKHWLLDHILKIDVEMSKILRVMQRL